MADRLLAMNTQHGPSAKTIKQLGNNHRLIADRLFASCATEGARVSTRAVGARLGATVGLAVGLPLQSNIVQGHTVQGQSPWSEPQSSPTHSLTYITCRL